ncbi:MAG: cysteine desulfurase [Eubacterium sp.]|nr:cysteine desulfurase [Eubacterium sp.]MDD7209219.1 cysteine desulfurase family protein [Lachnospiraceae bacterium]MDY5497955.1 cysteine desulfurase family protein [Anaerobutyricum sp.]
MEVIYLDNAATTPIRPEVKEAMEPYFNEMYENPSGAYPSAIRCREEIEKVRAVIAGTIHARPEEIYFTSGGTESDNWAIRETARLLKKKGNHIITSAIEHHAVLNTCRALEKEGFSITYLGVDEEGKIRLSELERAIRPETILISIMYANNEVGTIQPVNRIGEIAQKYGILFHTDGVQVYGHLPVDVRKSHISMFSASGHKLNGPKGIGFLYVRKEIPLSSLIYGGGQEKGKRAGTENVPGIIGLGKAAEISCAMQKEEEKRIWELREHLITRLLSEIPYCRVNGSRKNRLPGNCNVSFQFLRASCLLCQLGKKGICASAASACSTGSAEPSHVLTAMGLPRELANGTLRLTLGYQNTMEEMDQVADQIKEMVETLRGKSGQYHEFRGKNLGEKIFPEKWLIPEKEKV